MKIVEEHKDLFTVRGDWHYAHCIATDLGMGAGIAVPMQKKFRLRAKLRGQHESLSSPTCVLTGRVFNLITKTRSSGKPDYGSMEGALTKLRELVVAGDVKRIAMPKIGCGLDRLSWGRVKLLMERVFEDVDVEILVCVWK